MAIAAGFPNTANVVIIGQGGIVGSSLAHHLVARGWGGIVGVDQSAIPTDIGSTSHASDFCFSTGADKLSIHTTTYSQDFYEARGHYVRVGGMEVARVGDDARMDELRRKVGIGRAFGTNVSLISAREAHERFPLLEEHLIQGAMWDPDAGLVVPRSQVVAGELVDEAVAQGKLQAFANTRVLRIDVAGDRVRGVETSRGYIATQTVVLTAGIWGPLLAASVGSPLPQTALEHPLLFFGPYGELEGTGKEIVWPLLRDQGNSAYVRDTGDPRSSEGGRIEWGYYEPDAPRLVDPADIAEPEHARLSPSMHDLTLDQVMDAFQRGVELTPVLGELGWEERRSFNGLLSVTSDGGSLVGESPEIGGLWFGEAVWVKDGPGIGKLLADWMTDGICSTDPHAADIARFYPAQKRGAIVQTRCFEIARKIYTPAVHPREPFATGRELRTGPFYLREAELGGYFLEVAGWERAHGYQSNEATLLDRYRDRVPERKNEWDGRHFWEVSNAEHLELSQSVGMINLSHFAIFDVSGPDAEALLEYLCVARVGGKTAIGRGVYTHFLNAEGGIYADLTIVRLSASAWRVICGGDTGHRDLVWIVRMARTRGFESVTIQDRTDEIATLGVWGPKARETLAKLTANPRELDHENFPFATAREIRIDGMSVWAFRISYVGEQGWELYFPFSQGLRIWDLLYELGVVPVGIETYANSRRLEKSLRLQNADLETDYNLFEADLARPLVKPTTFHGREAYLAQRAWDQQPARLCTLSMLDNIDSAGVARYPVGAESPIVDAQTGEVLIDARGRRSYTTSVAFGPSVGKNLILSYLPREYAQTGRCVEMEYFAERYPLIVEAVGYRGLYDPENSRPRS